MGHLAPLDPRLATMPVRSGERRLRARLEQGLAASQSNRQCVSLAKVAVSDFRSVQAWRRGPGVLAARWPIGTPLATFLDRDGNGSHLYDGGVGVGAPGNMTSHAAVLVDYIDGPDGAPEAILVLDQHALLDAIRRMIYPVDAAAFGTGNAANYHLIADAEGRFLGGTANPAERLAPACAPA